jgi:hypothetical protein
MSVMELSYLVAVKFDLSGLVQSEAHYCVCPLSSSLPVGFLANSVPHSYTMCSLRPDRLPRVSWSSNVRSSARRRNVLFTWSCG